MELFLTIDAGGTSTRALVHDTQGNCFGYAVAGGGNPTASGIEAVADAVSSAATEALAQARMEPAQVEHALAAMAGSAVGITGVDRGLAETGVSVPLQLGSDLEAMFFSGTAELSGMGLVAGTGAAAIIVRDGVTTDRSDGRGWLLGDVGSGYWIARKVIRAATADLDRRGPRTAMTDDLLRRTGVTDDRRSTDKDDLLDRLLPPIHAIPTPGIARFAPIAFAHADTDDVARSIVDAAGQGLSTTARALQLPDPSAPVVVGGSVLFHQAALRARVADALRETGWTGELVPVADGTAGAVVLNLRAAGYHVDATTHERIRAALGDIRAQRG